MATKYPISGTRNWSADTAWSTTGSGGANDTTHAVATDTVIFDAAYTGTLTVDAASLCTNLTCLAGCAGTLALGSQNLTVSGAVTFVSTFHLTGTTNTLRLSITGASITSGGLTIPGTLALIAAGTFTLGDDILCGTFQNQDGNTILNGSHNLTCVTLNSNRSLQIVSGQGITVTGAMNLSPVTYAILPTIRSVTGGNTAALTYTGPLSACKVAGMTFTDIVYTGSPVTNLDNWYGSGACSGITNRTSLDIGGGGGFPVLGGSVVH